MPPFTIDASIHSEYANSGQTQHFIIDISRHGGRAILRQVSSFMIEFVICATICDLCDKEKTRTLKLRASQIAKCRTQREMSHRLQIAADMH
jgi:hypothetical protein